MHVFCCAAFCDPCFTTHGGLGDRVGEDTREMRTCSPLFASSLIVLLPHASQTNTFASYLRDNNPPQPMQSRFRYAPPLPIAAAKNCSPEVAQSPGCRVALARPDPSYQHHGYHVAQSSPNTVAVKKKIVSPGPVH